MFKHIYFILVVLVLSNLAYAQNATPSRYTDFIGLRCYASGANAGADSLNANWDDIDSTVEALNDSIAAVKADVYSVIDYAGGVIDGTVMWADMSTSAKATIVQVTGTQSIAGAKTFTDNMNTESILPVDDATYNLGSISKQWYRGYFNSLRTHQLYVINPVDTSEKAEITFDGTQVDFGTSKVKIDTFEVGAQTVALVQDDFSVPDLGDTVLTLPKLVSSLYMELSGSATAGIEKILCDVTVPAEHLLYITTANNSYTVMFEDGETDGNLLLSADFTMGKGDVLVLKASYKLNALETLVWQEVSRSNN